MRKLHVGIMIVVFILFLIGMSMLGATVSKYDKIDRDTEKLACEGHTFYDSINNRRCCLSDTNAGTSQCVRNWVKP